VILSKVQENLGLCLRRTRAAASRVNRDVSQVTLVAVTKGAGVSFVKEAIDAGIRHIGENKIQEVLLKYENLNDAARTMGASLSWHMIGHLQTNKVKDAVRLFDLIHSVDSIRLAEAIDREAVKINKCQDVLLEVNVSGEASKSGFAPCDVKAAIQKIDVFSNLRVRGLMTIAPIVDHSEKARVYFRQLKQLSVNLFGLPSSDLGLPFLSMGMTDDFEVAVEEGATHVRIGRGIFGER
jgi:pyridoxal phosphate enzyme (YggS family)